MYLKPLFRRHRFGTLAGLTTFAFATGTLMYAAGPPAKPGNSTAPAAAANNAAAPAASEQDDGLGRRVEGHPSRPCGGTGGGILLRPGLG